MVRWFPSWQTLESFSKTLAAVCAAIGAVLIPYFVTQYTEQNRRAQVYLQIITEREKADTLLRKEMFQNLLTGYFGTIKDDVTKDNEESFRRRIVLLELLTMNFEEFFNAKPLFVDLYDGLMRHKGMFKDEKEQQRWSALEAKVLRAAKDTAAKQASTLNNIGTSSVFALQMGQPICIRLYDRSDFETLKQKDEVTPFVAFRPSSCGVGQDAGGDKKNEISAQGSAVKENRTLLKELTPGIPKCSVSVTRNSLDLKLVALGEADARILVTVYDDTFCDNVYRSSERVRALELNVSYFDLPYMDNLKLHDGNRFALVLRKIDRWKQNNQEKEMATAEIEALRFKSDFMSLRDRPLFEETLRKLEARGS